MARFTGRIALRDRKKSPLRCSSVRSRVNADTSPLRRRVMPTSTSGIEADGGRRLTRAVVVRRRHAGEACSVVSSAAAGEVPELFGLLLRVARSHVAHLVSCSIRSGHHGLSAWCAHGCP